MIRLTDEEIKNSFEVEQGLHEFIVGKWVAKAQLKKVVEFLLYYECESVADGIGEYRHRNLRIPEEKWQALQEEVKG